MFLEMGSMYGSCIRTFLYGGYIGVSNETVASQAPMPYHRDRARGSKRSGGG